MREAGGISEQEIDVRILREAAVIENGSALSIRLQLLVLDCMQPVEAELKLVLAMRPRHIIARLIAEVGVLPRKIAGAPGYVIRSLKLNLRHAMADVVVQREETGGGPSVRLR